MADTKPKSSKRDLWFKFGRFITGVTIACFFLPFFGVSCEGMEVVHISGADMAGGCKPGGLITDAQEQENDLGPSARSGGTGDIKVDNVEREPLAIVALGLALVVAGLSWVRSRGAMLGAFALSIACIGALAGLHIKVGGDLDKAIEGELSKKSTGSSIMRDTKVESGSRFGLWLSIGGLLGAAALTGLALKEKERVPFAPTTPPPA